ncbi:MAG: T9SS type A sorting domain-containing protein, partial [Bacteroidetes bacterium]|nr:T9SS type A sorting domain-containing protein [Bacteroidota bacterium]
PTKTQHYMVTGTDNNSCQSIHSVQVVVALCMGVDELKTENLNINVYPNPTNGEFTVEAPDNTHLIIMNATGQIVLEQTSTSNKTEISLGNFANGIYFVKAGSVVKKVVKE